LTQIGNGIINADGELWKVLRKAGLHFLSAANLKVLTDVALPRYLLDSIKVLEETPEGSSIDLEGVFLELNTQLMGKMAYDVSRLLSQASWNPYEQPDLCPDGNAQHRSIFDML
jgi:hypothetical protein